MILKQTIMRAIWKTLRSASLYATRTSGRTDSLTTDRMLVASPFNTSEGEKSNRKIADKLLRKNGLYDGDKQRPTEHLKEHGNGSADGHLW